MMFGLFKKNKKDKLPQLTDIDDNPLVVGDLVDVLRYELGKCKLVVVEESYFYESIKSGEQVSWLKMIDASTDRQKVKKIISDSE
ncbi:hypothetical protein [Fulvivirga lutimaris]|uniref:hypothetical protein n=1 Tax=Fulvivirga lutimaris TaxID=1819566 RepID=UPI001FEC392C|nr:hypothetical protein [Fulvivirga lutimaris]